jgi:hypothetical protein
MFSQLVLRLLPKITAYASSEAPKVEKPLMMSNPQTYWRRACGGELCQTCAALTRRCDDVNVKHRPRRHRRGSL